MKLWLDDVRTAPEGWTWVKSVREAKMHLLEGNVEFASLDHDLGDACDKCWKQETMAERPERDPFCDDGRHCECSCHEDGSDLVRWMAAGSFWPKNKPVVHSMNPAGAAYMRGVIERYFVAERAEGTE